MWCLQEMAWNGRRRHNAGTINRLLTELLSCVRENQLVKAKFLLKGLTMEERRCIVNQMSDDVTPLFVAAQYGHLTFLNYLIDECGAGLEMCGVYEVGHSMSNHQIFGHFSTDLLRFF